MSAPETIPPQDHDAAQIEWQSVPFMLAGFDGGRATRLGQDSKVILHPDEEALFKASAGAGGLTVFASDMCVRIHDDVEVIHGSQHYYDRIRQGTQQKANRLGLRIKANDKGRYGFWMQDIATDKIPIDALDDDNPLIQKAAENMPKGILADFNRLLTRDGEPLASIGGTHEALLFDLLRKNMGQEVDRERAIAHIWGRADIEDGRAKLNQVTHRISIALTESGLTKLTIKRHKKRRKDVGVLLEHQ